MYPSLLSPTLPSSDTCFKVPSSSDKYEFLYLAFDVSVRVPSFSDKYEFLLVAFEPSVRVPSFNDKYEFVLLAFKLSTDNVWLLSLASTLKLSYYT